MKFQNTLIISVFFTLCGFAQNSIEVTYTGVDIWTNGGSYDNSCQGSPARITIHLPPGDQYEVTGLKTVYAFQSMSPEAPQTQRSRVRCLTTENLEMTFDSENDTKGDLEYYSRSSVDIANGVYLGGDSIVFELEVWRALSGSCSNTEQFILGNQWTIELFHTDEIPFRKVGVHTTDPNQSFHVDGKIQLGNDNIPPTNGTIMYQNDSFYGYANGEWQRLSQEKEILGVTNIVTNGSVSYAGLTGLKAANQMCKDDFPDEPTARMYFSEDINDAVIRGNISGVQTNTNYWTVIHVFEGLSSTSSAMNNCYNFLSDNGAFSQGTTVKFFINSSPGSQQLTGNWVDYNSSAPCGNVYRIVCGK